MTTVNLLPWREERRRLRAQQYYAALGAAFVIAALVVGLAHVVLMSHLDAQKTRNQYLEDEIARVESEIEEIERLEDEKERLLARMEIIQSLQQDRAFAMQIMEEMVLAIPDGVRLNRFSFNGNRIELEGTAQSNARVSAFMRNLEASELMDDPALGGIDSESGSGTYEFTLHVQPDRPEVEHEEVGA